LSDGGGLNILDLQTDEFIRYQYDPANPSVDGISGNKLWGILQDKMGSIWISEAGGVLNIIDRGSHRFNNLTHNYKDINSLSNNQYIGKIVEDNFGSIWIASSGGGLDRYNRETMHFEHFRHDPSDPSSLPETFCQSVFECSDRKLWVSTEKWIVLFDKQSEKVIKKYPAKNLPCTPLEDKTNHDVIWWGSWGSGLIQFQKSTGSVKYLTFETSAQELSLDSKMVLPFIQDDDGLIWIIEIGGGVSKFNPDTKKIVAKYQHIENDPTSLSSNTVWHIFRDSAARIWFSTENGLNLFDPEQETFKSFSKTNNSFPINTVSQILEDDNGWLWVAGYTTGEIVHFNPDTSDHVLYTKAHGIHSGISGPFKPMKTQDGEMWFYGRGGVTTFNPHEIKINLYKAPVFLTSITQNGKDIVVDRAIEKVSEIHLDWQQNNFEFEITALNYRNSKANQYKYILEGFDSDWYNSGTNRGGRYAKLPGGQYTLRIRGANNDGIWSDKEATLNVKVDKPFWETSWFYLSLTCIFLVGNGLVLIYFKKIRSEIKERKHAEKIARESKTQFEKMIAKSPLPMIITDQNQDILFFNDKFIELFGYTLDDVSAAEKWWKTAYPDEKYRTKVQQSWMKAIKKAEENKTDIPMQIWDLTIKDRTKRSCEFYM
ncbi:MAG: PAS domain S-box protein, partial [Desulfobacteraceae bacterium]|nr:PAS domain S-box protein [Desulfobacteraceae bacterium]